MHIHCVMVRPQGPILYYRISCRLYRSDHVREDTPPPLHSATQVRASTGEFGARCLGASLRHMPHGTSLQPRNADPRLSDGHNPSCATSMSSSKGR
jgi:hypothetical protein